MVVDRPVFPVAEPGPPNGPTAAASVPGAALWGELCTPEIESFRFHFLGNDFYITTLIDSEFKIMNLVFIDVMVFLVAEPGPPDGPTPSASVPGAILWAEPFRGAPHAPATWRPLPAIQLRASTLRRRSPSGVP
jgi:hypothetical protein